MVFSLPVALSLAAFYLPAQIPTLRPASAAVTSSKMASEGRCHTDSKRQRSERRSSSKQPSKTPVAFLQHAGLADIGAAPPAPPQTAADEQEGEPEALLPAAIPRWMRAVEKNIQQNRNNPPAKWFQLATIDETSRPRCRTVVFRGFVDKTSPEGLIKIITDARSQKVGQVERNPAAEACWYFERSRDQFRIAGNLRVVSPQETDERWARERVNTWKALRYTSIHPFSTEAAICVVLFPVCAVTTPASSLCGPSPVRPGCPMLTTRLTSTPLLPTRPAPQTPSVWSF